MNAKSKKEERRHIELLSSLLNDFPEGEICPKKNDPPDFEIVSENTATHAIEHTRLYRPSDGEGISLQGQEAEKVNVVEKACEIYEQRGGVPTFVLVDFCEVFGLQRSSDMALSKRSRQVLAEPVVDLVETADLGIGEDTIKSQPGNWPAWPQEINRIFVARYEWLKKSLWFPVMAGVVPQLTSEMFQESIDKKDKRLPTYSGRYDYNWLVIVELGTCLSSDFDLAISEAALTHTYQSDFDRIFFLRLLRQQVFDLSIASKGA